jgi:hypothetical protein
LVASTFVPTAVASVPLSGVALAKLSFGGGA